MAACQHFILDVEMPNEGRTTDPTRQLLADLPPARSQVEELLHRVTLARLAADYMAWTRVRRSRRHGLPASVARILLDDSEAPAKAFERWSRRTFKPHTIQAEIARRASTIIRSERATERLNLPAIARTLDCSERDLRVAFRHAYGMTPRRYHNTVRALHSVDVLLADPMKISEIAKHLGFKSAKDVYRLMEEITG